MMRRRGTRVLRTTFILPPPSSDLSLFSLALLYSSFPRTLGPEHPNFPPISYTACALWCVSSPRRYKEHSQRYASRTIGGGCLVRDPCANRAWGSGVTVGRRIPWRMRGVERSEYQSPDGSGTCKSSGVGLVALTRD